MIKVPGTVSKALIAHLVNVKDQINFDGLCVTAVDGGYRIETPSVETPTLTHTDLLNYVTTKEVAPYVTNWYYWESTLSELGRHRRAFLRRAEGAHKNDVPTRYRALGSDDSCLTERGTLRETVRYATGTHR